MIAIFRFAYSPLDDPEISFDQMAAFGSDHVQRMSGNNPNGDLSALIAATVPVLASFHDSLDSDQSKLGIRKSNKVVKDQTREEIKREVAKIEAVAIAQYGPDAPQILQMLPQGRTVFTTSRDDRIQDHLQTLVDGVTGLQADLGAGVVTQATDLRDQWDAIYTASEESTGQKQGTEAAKQAAKDALSWRLYQNVVAIADLYPRDPDKIRAYFQQSLLGIPEPTGIGDGDGGGGGNGGGGNGDGSSGGPSSSDSSDSSTNPSSSSGSSDSSGEPSSSSGSSDSSGGPSSSGSSGSA